MNKIKRLDTIFTEAPKICAGWLDLEVNNGELTIPVSYVNSRFFYDLLTLARIAYQPSFGSLDFALEIDCEGYFAWIHLKSNLSYNEPEDEIDYHDIQVSVSREIMVDNIEDYVQCDYIIDREKFVFNVLNLIYKNIDIYNIDFCCDDIADKLSQDYFEKVIKEEFDTKLLATIKQC